MGRGRLLGIVVFFAGVVLIVFGYRGSASSLLADRLADSYVDYTTWYVMGGVAAAAAGCGLALLAKQA
jgi:drug/metabolite transporter (DMT)-like permease